MKKLTMLLAIMLFVLVQPVIAQPSPIPMLENAADNITATLKQNRGKLKQNPKIIHQAVQKYLVPIVDVRGMSRSVLGRQAWSQATSAERSEFTKEFTKLVIRTYSNPLAEYDDEKVKFLPVRGSIKGRFVKVNSVIIRNNGPDIPLSYSLVSKKGQWKVYDLSVEGVSLLQSFRSQFGQALRNSNMQDLIKQMRKTKAS